MRIVFMGTPDFAVPTLEALIEAGHEVVACYTQPDKEQGRGKKIVFSPVKECALKHGIPVMQPKGLRKPERVEELRAFQPDVIVVVAYGVILRKPVLELAKYGCINVHASLLPMYRGAAPIQWAVLNGDKETGVTIMQMDEGLDTGDILAVDKIQLAKDETGDSLFEKLSRLGGPLLLKVLKDAEAGTLHPVKQGETTTAYASMLDKKMGLIDFTKDAEEIDRWVRGLNSWPSAYHYMNGKMLKIWKAEPVDTVSDAKPGTVIEVTRKDFTVACGKGALKILELQPEGKKRMPADAYLRGYPMNAGDTFDV